ncbi:hypothetical protein EJB05_52133, partial [Eragrostis curvula]
MSDAAPTRNKDYHMGLNKSATLFLDPAGGGNDTEKVKNARFSNKEKRPPLKRGQLKLQIARTLGSLVVPGSAKNRERSFGR